MQILKVDISRLFKVGDIFASGGNKVELQITEILDDRIRISSTSSRRKDRLLYSKISVAIEAFDAIDPQRIQTSMVEIMQDRHLPFTQNETYLYGFAREYRIRKGVARFEDYAMEFKERVAYSKALSTRDRAERLARAARMPEKALVTSTVYRRNPDVVATVLIRAAGVCEECKLPAPFLRRDGEPYLEVHHVIQLALGGEDTVENAVAVCPNCHRRAHYG